VTIADWNYEIYKASIDDDESFERAVKVLRKVRQRSALYFIGNGGSAAIASHMAIDFLNKGRFNACSLNDAAALTCLANDYGYKYVFSHQLARCIQPGDILVAISSSGESENILLGADVASQAGAIVITLSGFAFGNALKKVGDINFHCGSDNYRIVETAHLALLHGILETVVENDAK
jgi:D-sedoheptulose 7-phosphate isomerase